jgi:hypothetical protein
MRKNWLEKRYRVGKVPYRIHSDNPSSYKLIPVPGTNNGLRYLTTHHENIGGLAISGLIKRMNGLVIFGLNNQHCTPLTFKSTSVWYVNFIYKLPQDSSMKNLVSVA